MTIDKNIEGNAQRERDAIYGGYGVHSHMCGGYGAASNHSPNGPIGPVHEASQGKETSLAAHGDAQVRYSEKPV